MQKELEAEAPGRFVLAAINQDGFEASAPDMAELGDIALLQDTVVANAWVRWQAVYRDVVIVDAQGRRVEAFNLTEHNLADAAEYEALKARLLAVP